MAAHELDDRAEVQKRRKDLGADRGVALDLLELLVGERSLLGDDLLAHSDLPDIVQPAGGAHRVHLVVGELELARDRGRHVGNPRAVSAEIGILRFEGVDQRFEGRDRDLLQIGALPFQLGGASLEVLVLRHPWDEKLVSGMAGD